MGLPIIAAIILGLLLAYVGFGLVIRTIGDAKTRTLEITEHTSRCEKPSGSEPPSTIHPPPTVIVDENKAQLGSRVAGDLLSLTCKQHPVPPIGLRICACLLSSETSSARLRPKEGESGLSRTWLELPGLSRLADATEAATSSRRITLGPLAAGLGMSHCARLKRSVDGVEVPAKQVTAREGWLDLGMARVRQLS